LQPGDTSLVAMLLKMAVMGLKIAAFLFFFMWVRWTLPRFRFDQLMRVAWKGLVPAGLGLVALAVVLVYYGRPLAWGWSLAGNVAMLALTLGIASVWPGKVTGRQEICLRFR
jgi:NADH-quinone oxidoreductase subunit H